jgi:hypothetical protein
MLRKERKTVMHSFMAHRVLQSVLVLRVPPQTFRKATVGNRGKFPGKHPESFSDLRRSRSFTRLLIGEALYSRHGSTGGVNRLCIQLPAQSQETIPLLTSHRSGIQYAR